MISTGSGALRTGAALFVLYVALTSGFDSSEGRDDAALARHVLRTGRLGMDTALNPNWVRGTDGRYYSAHEVGNVIPLIPVVYLADHVGRTMAARVPPVPAELLAGAALPLVAALYVALTAAAFYVCLSRMLGVDARTGVLITLSLGLTTILAPYSRMLFDGVLGGMLIAWALAYAAVARTRGSAGAALAAGFFAGAAFATRQPLALLAACVVGHLAFDAPRQHRMRLLACFAAGVLPALVWQGWYNAVRTGAPYMPAVALPQFQRVNGAGNVVEGLAGLLFSPGKSMFLYSPLLLLAPFGWMRLRRIAPGCAWGLLGGVAAYLLVHAHIRNWSGEWGWGPRYTVPLTMPFMLPAALAIQTALKGPAWQRSILAALAVAALCVQIVGVSTNWHYRSAWLSQRGLYDRSTLEWSLTHGQLGEIVRTFARNVARLTGAAVEPLVITDASAPTIASGNGINVWPTVAVAAGLPLWLVAGGMAAILWCVVAVWRWALGAPREPIVSWPS